MNKTIRTEVPLHFTGEAPAVFQEEGSLLKNIEEVEVETLPAKLPAHIEVDISGLDDFSKTIHVSDLNVPEGVEVLVDGEELICKVEPPRSEEEIAALEEEVGDAIPEGAAEESAEGGEEGEGEAAEEGSEATEGGEKPAETPADKPEAKKE
jgi:large subunit ribosomal protein L25